MALCGAALGLIFTVAHRATTPLWGIDFPYGIVLGVLAAAAVVGAMRLLWESRLPAVGAAVGFAVGILALAFGGVGGGVIVANDGWGWTWVLLAVLTLAVGLVWPDGWPRLRRRARSEVADTMDEP